MTKYTDEIELASPEFPLLGYTVIATLKGIEVQRDHLRDLLSARGLATYLPAVPEPVTSLSRAMRAWIKQQATSGSAWLVDANQDEDIKSRQMIRSISAPHAPLLIMSIVKEKIDLAELGLSYLTNMRVALDKDRATLNLTTTPTGFEAVTQTSLQDQALLASLTPYWERYRTLLIAGDLARMVQRMIADLDASALRPGGGVYFVPYARRDALVQLKDLIERALPAPPDGENTSSLATFSHIDRPGTKKQMSSIVHTSFMAELIALHKDLDRFVQQAKTTTPKGKQGHIRRASMQDRLAQYQTMRAKVTLYSQLLGMRQQEILRGLDELQATAHQLLEEAATIMSAEQDDNQGDLAGQPVSQVPVMA